MTNLVLQSFGRENEYKRAILTIWSYFACSASPLSESRVLLFTDNPGYFTDYLAGLPVSYVQLTPEKIKQMRGSIDFLHRMKIALIEESFTTLNGHILYADSDTFFTADPESLMQSLTPGKSYMHVWEYAFEYLRDLPLPGGASFREFVQLIESKDFVLADGSTMQVTAQHSSWNAGVMMFHESHKAFIPDVYALTDQFYPPTGNHASEQYAFSIMLQTRTDLQPCEQVIYHYWYRIKKQVIDEFLATSLHTAWSRLPADEKRKIVQGWINMLPGYLDRHVFTLRDNAIQAFNDNKFGIAYKWASKALIKKPLSDTTFIKDVLYHTKRWILRKQ